MLNLDVLLDFCCCTCGGPMTVTLRCEGEGLAEGNARALVKVSCPSCRCANQVIFAPESGEVIDVMREVRVYRLPIPSMN